MTEPTSGYLAELERAVSDLPRPLADDILRGVREELDGLDAAEAAERIAELGDPEFIAASAREGVVVEHPGDPSRYAILTVLLLAVGWVVGVVLLWASKTWTRRDKVIGTLVLPVVAILGVLISVAAGSGIQLRSGGFSPLASGLIVAAIVAPFITTPYLLVRARGRAAGVVDGGARRQDAVWYTVITTVALLIGGIVVPVIGWAVGVVLLWLSRTWKPVDKMIGTLVPPLGGAVTLWFMTRPAYSGMSVTIETENGPFHGADVTELLVPLPVPVLWWIASALPLITFVYLLVRARILRR